MFKRMMIACAGLAMFSALSGCADQGEVESEESVSESAQALSTYGHLWDVHYRNSNGVNQALYNAEAVTMVQNFGLHIAMEDYCINSTLPSCVPSAGKPHPAWVHFKYTANETWSAWYYKADATRADSPFLLNADPQRPFNYTSTSASFSCYRIASGSATNNWQCTAGGGNGLYWSEVTAKYGEGPN
ncbi:MAG: hypothetical protein QM784_25325 [Polyangiaceae bacterium]